MNPEELAHVHVFKTNIRTETDKLVVKELFDQPAVHDWHVDTEDVDCVLRIVSRELEPQHIISALTQKGFMCSELE
jgi:hypothetical protein